jgi:DNA-binding NarL/FixJ family response regulator
MGVAADLRDPITVGLVAATGLAAFVVAGPGVGLAACVSVAAVRLAAGVLARRLLRPRHLRPVSWRAPLSPKEAEVAILVAEGLTNREIAERFVLSERTIDNHVFRIMNKLSVHSRTQIGVWVAERRLGNAHPGTDAPHRRA